MATLPDNPLRSLPPDRLLLHAVGAGLFLAVLTSAADLLPHPALSGPSRHQPQPGFEPFGPWRLLLQTCITTALVAAEAGRQRLAPGRWRRWAAHALMWTFWGPVFNPYDGNGSLATWAYLRGGTVILATVVTVGVAEGWRWLQARLLGPEAAG